MEIGAWTKDGEWSATPALNRTYRKARALGLESNIAELEAFGFTVVENALSPDLTTHLRDKIIELSEQRLQRTLDLDKEEGYDAFTFIPYLLYQDQAFEQAVLCEKPLTLIDYLLGESACLSSCGSHVKGPGGDISQLVLHSDNGNGGIAPFPPYAMVANVNYVLTDYTKEKGALAMVPGSHRAGHHVPKTEMSLSEGTANPNAIAVEVPAGSAVIWHGNTWHGSWPRTVPGLRINLATYFCRQNIIPQEDYLTGMPDDFRKRNGPDTRLGHLVGLNRHHGWREEGPDFTNPTAFKAGQSWHS